MYGVWRAAGVDQYERNGPLSVRKRAILFAAALLLANTETGPCAETAWWNPNWTARRQIDLRGARRSSQAPLVAYVQFRDFVPLNKDASDVRVVNEKGKPVPSRVVFYHPRVYCLVAFEPETPDWTGHVYYGNPRAPDENNGWRPRSGLLLTTYRRKASGCNNWNEMQESIRRSQDSPDGAGFRPAVFDGANPYGSSTDFISVYDGYFYASQSGEYQFSTISDNASFVFINGKMVTEWAGRHGVAGGEHGQHKGTVRLAPGAHHVQYYHMQFTGRTIAELAWWLPGAQRPQVMPPEVYPPAYQAAIGLEERKKSPECLEFGAEPARTIEVEGHHYIEWKFGNLSGVRNRPAGASLWDFGNGVTSNDRNPTVWFFHPGDYEVTLRTTLDPGGERTIKRWVRVADMIQLDVSDKPAAVDEAARTIAGYPVDRLVEGDREAVLALLTYREMYDAIEKVCRTWLDKVYRNRDPVPVDVVLELGHILEDVRGKPAEAESVYMTASQRLQPNNSEAYRLYLTLGELQSRLPEKADAAVAALQKAESGAKGKSRSYQRRVEIAMGDAYRAKLDRKEAGRHFQQAERLRDQSSTDVSLRSSLGLTVESYLERKEYDDALEKLGEWAEMFPADKLGGYWSLLMGRCLVRLDRQEDAVAELSLAARLDPYGNYTRDILEELGYTYAWLRRYNEALESLNKAAGLFDDPVKRKQIEAQIELVKREARQR